jgi:hypothetical protein
MAKQFAEPQPIKVSTNIHGVPVSLVRNGRREKILAIYQRWRTSDRWWGDEVERDYFTVRTNTGFVCDISRDTTTKQWYLNKIHD